MKDTAAKELHDALLPGIADLTKPQTDGNQPPTDAAPGSNPPAPPAGPGLGKGPSTEPKGDPMNFDWLDPKPKDGQPPANPQQQPGPAKPTEEPPKQDAPPTVEWSPEKFISEKIGDPKEFLSDDKQIKDFGGLKDIAANALKENKALQLQLAQANAGGGDGSGAVLPESEAVEKLQSEIKALSGDAEKWREEQARRDLSENQALRREFDAPRASILRELEATAREIDLDGNKVKEFLGMDSKFRQAKWTENNIEDETAADLFKNEGANFLGLSLQKDEILKSEDPFSAIEEWEERSAAFGAQMAAKLDDIVARQYQAAAVKVTEKLHSEGEDNIFFTGTDAGRQALDDIKSRFAAGNGYTPEETVMAIARQSEAEAFKAYAAKVTAELTEAKQQIARLRGLDPANHLIGTGSVPGTPVSGAGGDEGVDVFSTGDQGGGSKPLVSTQDIAAAVARTN